MPRLNVSKQTLYKLDRTKSYGTLDDVITGAIDTALIREQWDQLVRVAASLRNRTAPAHVVLRRLASSAPSDRLAKALTALGRALRSLFLLRYIHEEELRARIIEQLRARGETITNEELARISPMAFSHIIPNGTYFARRTSDLHDGPRNGHVSPVGAGTDSDM